MEDDSIDRPRAPASPDAVVESNAAEPSVPCHLEPEMNYPLVIQRPNTAAEQLLLLFHRVALLGRRLAAEFPNAFVVSIAGAQESDLGSGRQWFSVRGIRRRRASSGRMNGMGTAHRDAGHTLAVEPIPPCAVHGHLARDARLKHRLLDVQLSIRALDRLG
jgi:hypothetical protein